MIMINLEGALSIIIFAKEGCSHMKESRGCTQLFPSEQVARISCSSAHLIAV